MGKLSKPKGKRIPWTVKTCAIAESQMKDGWALSLGIVRFIIAVFEHLYQIPGSRL